MFTTTLRRSARVSGYTVSRLYHSIVRERRGNGNAETVGLVAGAAAADEQSSECQRPVIGELDICIAKAKIGYMATYAADRVIGECLRTVGQFGEGDIEHAIQLYNHLGASVDKTLFLDIGANIGTHTLFALCHGFTNAICVEADAGNFKLLRVNQILNGLDARCVNVLAAASDAPGTLVLEKSPVNFGDHRIRLKQVGSSSIHGESNWAISEVPAVPIDCILAENGVSPTEVGLAWIDTQGHEGHVLSGASQLLAAGTPIVFEFWPYGLARSGSYSKLRHLLANGGRKIYDLRQFIATGQAEPITNLDTLYEAFIAQESIHISPHTDLLLF